MTVALATPGSDAMRSMSCCSNPSGLRTRTPAWSVEMGNSNTRSESNPVSIDDAFNALRTNNPHGIKRSSDSEICSAITALRTLRPGAKRRSVTLADLIDRVAAALDP
jgi:hypothetical protein